MSIQKATLTVVLAGTISLAAGFAVHSWLRQRDAGNPATETQTAAHAVGQLPRFSLPDLEGTTRNSTEWLGKVLVINFWATWCPPCRREMPDFIQLQDEFGAQGLQFVGIAIDQVELVRDFAQSIAVNYPILVGDTDAIELSRTLGNRFSGLPFSVIFDRGGKVLHVQAGELHRERIEEVIRPLLAN